MQRVVRFAGLVAAIALILLWPMAFNGGPVLYPDTATYATGGATAVSKVREKLRGKPDAAARPEAAARPGAAPQPSDDKANTPATRKQAISGRSIYYGLLTFFSWQAGGFAVMALVQALWATTALLLVLNRFEIKRARGQLAVALAMAAFTSLGFFAGTMMPDIFAGIGVAAIASLMTFGSSMRRPERAFWLFSLVFAGIAHSAILATLAGTFVLVTLASWRRRGAGHWLAASGLVIAVVAAAVPKPLIERFTNADMVSTPFLLSRSIGDGPAARLLSEDCPAAGHASCWLVPYLPLAGDDVLWGSKRQWAPGLPPFVGWAALPPEQRAAVSAEANAIVLESIKRYPVEQITASIDNSARQLVNLDLERFGWPVIRKETIRALQKPMLSEDSARYQATRIATGTFPLDLLSRFWLAVYLLGAAAIVVMLVTSRQRRIAIDGPTQMFVATLLTGVVLNALLNATFSAVVGRYQSRLSWLVLLSAILIGHALARARVTAPPALRALPI